MDSISNRQKWKSAYFLLKCIIKIEELSYCEPRIMKLPFSNHGEYLEDKTNAFILNIAKFIENIKNDKKDLENKNKDYYNYIYIERDKNIAHPDKDYRIDNKYKNQQDLKDHIKLLKNIIDYVFNEYKYKLPSNFIIEYKDIDEIIYCIENNKQLRDNFLIEGYYNIFTPYLKDKVISIYNKMVPTVNDIFEIDTYLDQNRNIEKYQVNIYRTDSNKVNFRNIRKAFILYNYLRDDNKYITIKEFFNNYEFYFPKLKI